MLKAFNSLFLLLFICCHGFVLSQDKTKVLLDADTANEVDDVFALSVILMDSTIEVTALNAAQWQASHWATQKTMEDSHRLNTMLLGTMGLQIKSNRGGVARMFDWGNRAQHSAAANEIIKQAKTQKKGEKLNVIALGALTNVASAIYIDPSITDKIRLYWLGTTYDFEKEILRKDDFNCAMDQYALSHLLFSETEMHIMPVSLAAKMKFDYVETSSKLENNLLGDFLMKVWIDHTDGVPTERTIWDLTIVNAFLHPEWMKEVEITSSKDNGNRKLFYYKDFDADMMRADFFSRITSYKRP